MILIPLLFLCFPGYLAAQVIAIARLRGGWLWASLVPALPMLLVLVATIKAYWAQSNLWPLLLLFAAPIALAFELGILGLHRHCKQRIGKDRGLPDAT